MNTAALRQLIAQARQQESGSQALSRFLQTQLERLHPSIRLPKEDVPGALSAFVIAYIEEVPDVSSDAAPGRPRRLYRITDLGRELAALEVERMAALLDMARSNRLASRESTIADLGS